MHDKEKVPRQVKPHKHEHEHDDEHKAKAPEPETKVDDIEDRIA